MVNNNLAEQNLSEPAHSIGRLYETFKPHIEQLFQNQEFTVIGDVESVNTSSYGNHYVGLIDKTGLMPQRITVFIRGSLEKDGHDLQDRRISVTGTVVVGKKGIQLEARSFRILKASMFNKIAEWREEYHDLIYNLKKALPRLCENIAVITSADSQGYGDFKAHLNFGKITLKDTKMQGVNIDQEIARTIEEINQSTQSFDCICILRGGGDSSSLFEYNKPALIEAIGQSEIPVLTAIGHHSDKFLCDEVADKSFSTPTALANYLTKHAQKFLSDVLQMETIINRHYTKITNNAQYSQQNNQSSNNELVRTLSLFVLAGVILYYVFYLHK